MTAITIPPLSPFPGRGAAPEDYIAQADTTMQQFPGVVEGIRQAVAAFNLGAGVLSAGYLPPVLYEAGISITLALQTVQRGDTTYAPLIERLPFVTGADFDMTAWRVVQGVTASKLAEPDAAAGLGFQPMGNSAPPSTVEKKLQQIRTVLDQGATGDGVTGDLGAILRARELSDYIYFPRVGDHPTTYLLDAYAEGTLDGAYVDVAPGVTLSFAASTYSLTRNINFLRDTPVRFRDVPAATIFPKSPPRYRREALTSPSNARERRRTVLNVANPLEVIGRQISWPTSDAFTDIVVTATADTMTFPAGAAAFKGSFVGLGPYETVAALFSDGAARGPIGVMFRGSNGFSVVFTAGGAANYAKATKNTGAAVTGSEPTLTWDHLGQGVYTSFNAENAMFSVTRTSRNEATIKLNGKTLTVSPYVGDIFEVGFVCFTSQAFSIHGFTVERRTDALIGGQMHQEIRIWGDSTAEEMPGSWSTMIAPLLDGAFGVKVNNIVNRAVSGTDIGYAYADMQANGFGNARSALLCFGTNNVQGNTPILQFEAVLRQIMALMSAAHVLPFIIIPWMWYPKALAGGVGQNTLRYEFGAAYRMVLKRVGAELGAVVLDMTEELPNPDPRYVATRPGAAMLRDCIHQDTFGHQLYAMPAAQAFVDHYCALPELVEFVPPQAWFANGASPGGDLKFIIEKSGCISFSGTIIVSTIASGTAIMRLPRYLAASGAMSIHSMALQPGAGAVLGGCYLNYDAATREIRLILAPAGTGIVMASATYKAA